VQIRIYHKMQKNSVNRSIKTIFLNFTRKVCSGAKMGQNWPYLAQNTCFLRFCAFGCVISESSIWIKFLLFDCGYFGIYGIFVRPLDKILHIQERPFIFESFLKISKNRQKSQIFKWPQNRRKMSYGGVRGCKMGLLGPKNPKIYISGRSRPNRPIYVIWYSAGIGRKIYFPDSVDPGDPFCTLERLHNSFCDDSELD
jgi:hypothetical protein